VIGDSRKVFGVYVNSTVVAVIGEVALEGFVMRGLLGESRSNRDDG
jgi:hypothetical protein